MQTKFADNAFTSLTAAVVTTPAAGTSEAWTVTSTAAPLPAVATGVSQFVAVVTPGPTNTTFGVAGSPDPSPEAVLVTNTNDGTHLQVQRGYGGTIRTHQSGDVLTLVADQAWFTKVEAVTTQAAANTYVASTTLALVDAGVVVEANSGSTVTITVPPNASVAFPVGTIIELSRVGVGAMVVAAGAGVTILSVGAHLSLASQYSGAALRQRAANSWVLTGDLA